MRNRWLLLLLILCITLICMGCSNNSDKLDKIDVKIDTIKLNDEYGDLIDGEFGVYFISATTLFIKWYNVYTDDSNNEYLMDIKDSIDTIVLGKMYDMIRNGDCNKHEEEICLEVVKTGQEIANLHLASAKVEKEQFLREKNLKDLTDEELERLEADRDEGIVKIRDNINDILETYFIYE